MLVVALISVSFFTNDTRARARSLAVAAAGRKVDDHYARGLVLDALGNTRLGIARWNPAKCSLGYHVVRTIEGGADKHRKHAEEFPHDALGDRTDESYFAEHSASGSSHQGRVCVGRVSRCVR